MRTRSDQNGGTGVTVRYCTGFDVEVVACDNVGAGVKLESGNSPAECRFGRVRGMLRDNLVPVATSGFNTFDVDIEARCYGTGAAAMLSLTGANTVTAVRTHSRGIGSPEGVVFGSRASTFDQLDGGLKAKKWIKGGTGTTATGWELVA